MISRAISFLNEIMINRYNFRIVLSPYIQIMYNNPLLRHKLMWQCVFQTDIVTINNFTSIMVYKILIVFKVFVRVVFKLFVIEITSLLAPN